jgi:hypothetical protein
MSSPAKRKHKNSRGGIAANSSMEVFENVSPSLSTPSVDDPSVLALKLDAKLSSGRRISEASDETEPGSHFKPMWKQLMPFQVNFIFLRTTKCSPCFSISQIRRLNPEPTYPELYNLITTSRLRSLPYLIHSANFVNVQT